MKIAINIRSVANRGGIGRYTRRLLSGLSSIDKENEYVLFLPARFDYDASGLGGNFILVDVPGSLNRIIWENVNLPGYVRKHRPDVFFCPDYTLPVTLGLPSVITVHDLTFMRHPEGLSLRAKLLYRSFFPRSARKSRLILADSEHTRRDLIELGLKDAESVRTVHLGVDRSFFEERSEDEISESLSRYGLERGFLLFVGAVEERKNVRRLIEAYKLLKSRRGDIPPLILAGPKLDRADEILSGAAGVPGVRHLGYVEDAHLPAIYQAASGLVYPSLYEGFGLPPLEAMAAGTPVAVSRLTSLPEVVGESGIYIDHPESSEGIAEGIEALLNLGSKREEVVRSARERARGFTWEACARNTLDAIIEAAAQ